MRCQVCVNKIKGEVDYYLKEINDESLASVNTLKVMNDIFYFHLGTTQGSSLPASWCHRHNFAGRDTLILLLATWRMP